MYNDNILTAPLNQTLGYGEKKAQENVADGVLREGGRGEMGRGCENAQTVALVTSHILRTINFKTY